MNSDDLCGSCGIWHSIRCAAFHPNAVLRANASDGAHLVGTEDGCPGGLDPGKGLAGGMAIAVFPHADDHGFRGDFPQQQGGGAVF